ncbi:MAG: beta-galactosidase, partial [Paludibacter sp.]|nr:beta-galactosidase [Paludibacter sp.]
MKKVCILITGICLSAILNAANPFLLDLSKPTDTAPVSVFKMGNAGPAGKEILVNSRYLTIAGKPVVPVMGEMHFTRVPRQKWEETLLKMKAGGV